MGSESGKGKTTHLGICVIRGTGIWLQVLGFWLQVLGFPHARPRMYRFEVGVAACILIEAPSHSHVYSIKAVLDGSNFRSGA